MAEDLQQLYFASGAEWRAWLAQNHAKESKGVWLVYCKQGAGRASLNYEESVEEALCFGWVDSLIKRIDDRRYCRKFTPRKDDSAWSASNKARVARIIQEGRMTEAGLAKIAAARKSGLWEKDPRPDIRLDTPPEFAAALAKNKAARQSFARLAPSQRKHYIAWIVMAKRPETRKARIREATALLAKNQLLGLR